MKATKTRGKKATKGNDLDDALADLDRSIDEVLEGETEVGDEDGAEEEGEETEDNGEVTDEGDLTGKMVKLIDGETNKEVVGKVKGQNGAELEIVVREGSANVEYTANLDDVEVVGDAPAEDEKPKGKGKGAEKPEKPAEAKRAQTVVAVQPGVEVRRIPLDSIQVHKVKVREFVEDAKYANMVTEAKARKKAKLWPQRVPIEVDTSWEKPSLVEGLRRIHMMRELGETHVDAIMTEGIEDNFDRLFHGLRANLNRSDMHWLDIGKVFAKLCESEKYTQKKLAQTFGLGEDQVSRMIAATHLPNPILEKARDPGEGTSQPRYAPEVFFTLAGAPKPCLDEAAKAMKTGAVLTVTDARTLKKEHAKPKPAASGKPAAKPKPTRKGSRGGSGLKHVSLPAKVTGPNLKATVKPEELELTIHIEWTNKTYRGFDLMKEIKRVIDAAFKSETAAVDSFDGLAKELTAARGTLT